MATLMGLEPTTFAVTGRRSNQLSYSAKDASANSGEWWARLGLNQRPPACEADALPLSYAPVPVTAPLLGERLHVTLPLIVAAVLAAATSVHFPVATNAPAAQAAMDRGLFLYYAYDGQEAERAFEAAASADGGLATAYWGMALADAPDLNTPMTADRFENGQRAIRRAAAMESASPPSERRYIDVTAERYAGSFTDWQRDDAAYRRGMLALAESSGETNARLLAAEALLEHGGLAWDGGHLAAGASVEALKLVEAVLNDDPSNPMANHLCIHLYDLAADRSPALPCAQRLDAARFTPEAEHLAHMPAHYWIETGDYAAALASSERAYELLSALDAMPGGSQHVDQYRKHDVAVGYSAAMMLGNYAVAQHWATRMSSAYDLSFGAFTALRFGRYLEAFDAPESEFGNPSVRGVAALALGKTNDARAIALQLTKTGATKGYLPKLFLSRMAEVDGNAEQARQLLQDAVKEQQSSFEAELIPTLPAQEALGFFELRQNAPGAAIAAFNTTLEKYPNDPRALHGLADALAADGQHDAATRAQTRFQKIWDGADTNLAGADLL